MLTGGTVFGTGTRIAEWIGNKNGFGIMNNMCQFGDVNGSVISYLTINWGS